MKVFYLSLIFTVLYFSVVAQDTTYVDENFKDLETKQNAKYYRVITPTPQEDSDFLRTFHYLNGQMKSKITYTLKKDIKTNEGRHSYWYDTGELFYTIDFKKGKKHGNLIAYWKNGRKRRHDIFKRDKLKKGQVWNKKGEKIKYFPYRISPQFPGGKKALKKYLVENINIPSYHNSTQRVVVRFAIDTLGNTTDIEIVEKAHAEYMVEAYRVVDKMPKWTPGQQFGEVVKVIYSLPLIFQE